MIEVKNLTKEYGDTTAVKDISFKIGKGEIVGLLGPNGAGKSTTMNIITGFLSATDGGVLIEGEPLAENLLPCKRKIGYLPEVPPLYPSMTVYEYLSFVYDLKKVQEKNKKEHILEIMEETVIHDVKDKLILNLSKGYRQRVGLAGAIMGHPPILVLDEPTAGLDPKQVTDVRALIRKMSKVSTIILSSHILSEIQTICDRVLVLRKGELVADGTASEISAGADNKKAMAPSISVRVAGDGHTAKTALRKAGGVKEVEDLGESEPNTRDLMVHASGKKDIRETIGRVLAKQKVTVLEMSTSRLSLEDAFLDIMNHEEKESGQKDKAEKTSKKKKGGKK